ncbi:MAG: 16S rRNA (guanine(527)-N(7))-methyltransferase RsmG [Terriglobales bacterium]
MQTARISALLEPFLNHPLSEQQLNQISIYIDLLQRWNARINLTAIRTEEEIVTRHFGESLFLARHVFSPIDCHPERSQVIREADASAQSKDPYSTSELTTAQGSTGHWPLATYHRVLDIGSGAGFPALPLKIWAPEIHLTLIESNHKKSAFLKEVSRALTFTNINVIAERAETLAAREDHLRAHVVTLRAVEHFETILPQAIAFLADQGTLALLVGADQLAKLPAHTNLKWQSPIPIPNSARRVLVLGRICVKNA